MKTPTIAWEGDTEAVSFDQQLAAIQSGFATITRRGTVSIRPAVWPQAKAMIGCTNRHMIRFANHLADEETLVLVALTKPDAGRGWTLHFDSMRNTAVCENG